MTFVCRGPRRYAAAIGTAFWLGLLLPPDASRASQHWVYDRLTDSDAELAQSILQDVLERERSQQMRLWSNDATGVSGSVMPLRTFKIKTGHFCRDYRETVIANGELKSRDATACRTGEGLWIPIEN